MSDSVFDVILRTPWAGPWRRFRDPLDLVLAWTPPEIPSALARLDAELRAGRYAAGFVAYEAAAAFGLPVRPDPLDIPLVAFGVFAGETVESLFRFPAHGACDTGEWTPTLEHATYIDAIATIKERIARGDTYQINYTFRLRAKFDGSASALMRDLYAGQAGTWSAMVDFGSHAICSASPELFFTVADDLITCRPMKGTSPRGFWPSQDRALGGALQRSEKNRAENVMIVDMVRNDVGRLARVGSVRATSLFDVERYPSQWQMVSTVTGETPGWTAAALFEALFPSGSVTGAPKHSAMGIIRELETTPRGAYTGAIGYLSPRRRGHFSVAIRTVTVNRRTQTAELGIGSGVVWDSVDHDEYDECILKAQLLTGAAASGGARSAAMPAAARPASYAVSEPPRFRLLETLLWTPDEGFVLLDRHIERLFASAACFGFEGDAQEVRAMLANAVGDLRGASRIRLMLEADGSILCEAVDLSPLPSPMRVALAGEPIDPANVFLYHKTTQRSVYERARASRPDADTVILWNTAGEVTESAEANLVVVRDGRKVTPPVACGLLPGTRRAELLDSGDLLEERILIEQLALAEEIWLVNSVRGWVRATLLP